MYNADPKINTVGYFWPEKNCVESEPNSIWYSENIDMKNYPEFNNDNKLGLNFSDCGQINGRWAQNSISREMRKILKTTYPNAEKYGIYFLYNVADNSTIAKKNPELKGKQIVLVASYGRVFDNVFYYVVEPKVQKDVEQETVLNDFENISDSDKEKFCGSKSSEYKEISYYNFPFINFSYNLEYIDCSVYNNFSGEFCDAEQLAKYIEKSSFGEYTLEKLNNIFSELDYINLKLGNVTKKYLAKDKIPLSVSQKSVPFATDENLFSEDLFIVLNKACPSEILNKSAYLDNIEKCYIPYKAIPDINKSGLTEYHFEYLMGYKELETVDKNFAAVYDYPELYYMLLAIGEDPRNYGLDLVYLKPDTYNYESGVLTNSTIPNLNLTIYNSKEKVESILKPNIYLLVVDKKDSTNISGFLNFFEKYTLSKYFLNVLESPENSLLYLTFNPSYTLDTSLSNIVVKVFENKPQLTLISSSNPKYNFTFDNAVGEVKISFKEDKFYFNLPKDTNKDTFYLEEFLPGMNKKEIYCYHLDDDNSTILGKKYSNKELLDFVTAEKIGDTSQVKQESNLENSFDFSGEIVAAKLLISNLNELIAYEQYNRALVYLSVNPKKLANNDLIVTNFGKNFESNRILFNNTINRNLHKYLKRPIFEELYSKSLNDEKRNYLLANLNKLNSPNLMAYFQAQNNVLKSKELVAQNPEPKDSENNYNMPNQLTPNQITSLKDCGITGEELFGTGALCESCIYYKFNNTYYKYATTGKLETLSLGATNDLAKKTDLFNKCTSEEIATMLNTNVQQEKTYIVTITDSDEKLFALGYTNDDPVISNNNKVDCTKYPTVCKKVIAIRNGLKYKEFEHIGKNCDYSLEYIVKNYESALIGGISDTPQKKCIRNKSNEYLFTMGYNLFNETDLANLYTKQVSPYIAQNPNGEPQFNVMYAAR